jgi:hypothetical protein
MKNQVIVCSYKKDFCWLIHMLASLKRFSAGFLHPVVCVAPEDFSAATEITRQSYPEAVIKVTSGRYGQGFMRAQIAMMKADILCEEADNIFFLGSDCLAFDELSPEPYLDSSGRPAVLYSSYSIMSQCHADTIPWQAGVNRVLGFKPEYEFMRRLPSVFPRSIFEPMRSYVEKLHRMDFENYIYSADDGKTSEANILGAFAFKFMRDTCLFIDVADAGLYGSQVNNWPSTILQMWSHGGLDWPMNANVTLKNGSKTVGRTPRSVINEVLYGIAS